MVSKECFKNTHTQTFQDFPNGRQPQEWGANLLTGQIYAENCMKIKEIGPRSGCAFPSIPKT